MKNQIMALQHFKQGVLSDSQILSLSESLGPLLEDPANIQPAGIDISSLFEEIYELEMFSMPSKHERVGDVVVKLRKDKKAKLHTEPIFEPGKIYIAKLAYELKEVPYYCRTNTKSTIGRDFIHTKLLTDFCSQYDVVPIGYSGSMWLQIRPKFFRISKENMIPLTQLRVFNGDARLTAREIELLLSCKGSTFRKIAKQPMFPDDGPEVNGGSIGSLILSVDFDSNVIAYRTKTCDEPIVLSERGLNSRKYFDVITKEDLDGNGLLLQQGHGYLFGTTEACVIPGSLAAEVVAIDERFGELRSHFAGFIDPGFGYFGEDQNIGNSITLEVVPYESGIMLRNEQAIGMLCFEHMSQKPSRLYKGNYANQSSGPKLPRQFSTP